MFREYVEVIGKKFFSLHLPSIERQRLPKSGARFFCLTRYIHGEIGMGGHPMKGVDSRGPGAQSGTGWAAHDGPALALARHGRGTIPERRLLGQLMGGDHRMTGEGVEAG